MKHFILAALSLCVAAIVPCPALAQAALGANYNESLTTINDRELDRVGAQWLRGFLDMHLMNDVDPANDPNLKAMLAAAARGRHIILSLKWNYHQLDFPRTGSPEMKRELARLNELLPIVMGKVDILVIGNEPFIESKPDQRDERLNLFYEALADDVIAYRRTHGGNRSPTKLYMGAFNRLDLPASRTPAVERMLRYIASQPALSGADLHPHLPSLAANKSMLDYVLPRLRPDQKFLATEFSLVWLWKRHLSDAVPVAFTSKYGFDSGTKVYQVIDTALNTPMRYEEWREFLSSEPWYRSQQNYLSDVMALYRGTGRLAVATYGIRQAWNERQPFTAATDPWILNSVYAAKTVMLNADGSAHENFPWGDGFRKAVAGTSQ